MTDHRCRMCSTFLCSDEISLYRKLIARNAESYLCLDCLAQELSATREKLEDLIRYYYETETCTLFVK